MRGFRLANDTPTPPGWIYVEGDSDALDTVPFDRSIGLLVRLACIVGGPEPVRGCVEPRSVLSVRHRGGTVRVRANLEADLLLDVIERERGRIGGAR